MTLLRATLLLLACLLADTACAASFDCAKASSDTEKLICAKPALSSLDDQLQAAYRKASGTVADNNKDMLLKEQRNWIRYARNACTDEACLSRVYRERIDLLQHTGKYIANKASCDIPDSGSCRSVIAYRDPSLRIDSFNKSLAAAKPGTRVVGCYKLIDLPAGTAHGNHSFGGICRIDGGWLHGDVLICNDDMVGRFAMDHVEPDAATDEVLIDYVNTKCFGG